ncbi:hypothetical protein PINS_up014446 [Pythium insidiosum]|nr:hypothetical protein PINS_up014446 [Pythium insidiosum]
MQHRTISSSPHDDDAAATATRHRLADAPRLERAVLLRDGTVVGAFVRSRTSQATPATAAKSIVVLEPHAHSFTFVAPDGRKTRHLTPTARSSEIEMVDALLQFRNRFLLAAVDCTTQRPYLLESSLRRRQRLASPLPRSQRGALPWIAHGSVGRFRRARGQWGTFETRTLWNEELAVFQLSSIEGTARVQLHASGRVAYAQYYAALAAECERERARAVSHVLVEQTFTLSTVPAPFAAAVQVLRTARRARVIGLDTFECHCEDASVDLPTDGSAAASPSFRPLVSDHQDSACVSVSVSQLEQWVRSPASRLLDQRIAVELVHDACFIVEQRDAGAPSVLVLSLSAPTNSSGAPADADAIERCGELFQWVLVCCQRYIEVFRPDGTSPHQQFTVDTAPLRLEGFDRRDPARAILLVQRAASLARNSAHEPPMAVTSSPPLELFDESLSDTQVLEDVRTNAGRFRAFNGGSTRVVFPDRTILRVAPSGTCSFVHPDGSTSECTTSSVADERRGYVSAALNFAAWAFATPEERLARHRGRQEQSARVARELQRIAVQSRLNGSVEVETEAAAETDGDACVPACSVDALHDATQQHIEEVSAMLRAMKSSEGMHEETNEAFHSSSISNR